MLISGSMNMGKIKKKKCHKKIQTKKAKGAPFAFFCLQNGESAYTSIKKRHKIPLFRWERASGHA